MRRYRCLAVLLAAHGISCGAAFAATPEPASAPMPPAPVAPPALVNPHDPLPGLRTGGLPPEAGIFPELVAQGFRVLVDLRTEPETMSSVRAEAEAAGLAFHSIPIAGDVDLDLGAARALDTVLADSARGPTVVACASGNRSGALLAVRAFWLQGWSAEDALELGRAAGLTRLEPSVRQLLGLPPLPPPPPAPVPESDPPSSDR